MLGRRGPAQAAFTSAELRELGRLDGVELRVDPAEVELDPVSAAWLAEEGTFTARKNVELLREFAARAARRRSAAGAPDRAALPALAGRAPRRRPRRGRRRAPQRDRPRRGRRAARPRGRRAVETIEAGLVLRSVGYRAVPLPDVPFDERHFVLPNRHGRALTPEGEPLPGVYAVGWIKRGPTGILGTNKRDAEETIALPRGGPAGGRAARSRPRTRASRSTRCSPSARRAPSRPTAGARSTRSSASRAAAPSARA